MSDQPTALYLANVIDNDAKSAAHHTAAAAELRRLHGQFEVLRADLETQGGRLAACGIAATGYFESYPDQYWSSSLDDVLRLCAKAKALRADAERDTALLRQAVEALEWCEPSGIVGHSGITARKQIIIALRERLGDKV